MHRFRRTYEFVKTWAEVEAKVKDVQLLLCEKLMTVSKKTFHSRSVDVSKRHNVVWHKGIPYICIGYRSYACIRGKKKKEEAKMKNEELAKMIESIRVNVKHVLIFPEFKVELKTDKFTRKSVARVLKEKLNTSAVITEERYMFSAQIPELEKLLKYSYLKHQVEYCNQHPYAEPLYKPNMRRRRQRSPKSVEKEGETKQNIKQNQEDLSKSLFPVAHLKGRWGRIHLVSDKQALPREITDQAQNLSKCKKYRSNSTPVMEAIDNEETVDATFYLIGEAVDGNSIEVSIIDDVEFKSRTFSDEIAFICEKKDHLALPEIVVNRQEVSNLSDIELISTVARISFVPERREEEIETEIVDQSVVSSNVEIVSSENEISFVTEEHEEVISQFTPESIISSENTIKQDNSIVQHNEILSDFRANLNEDGQSVSNYTDIVECSTTEVVCNEYNDSIITEETSTCSIGGRISAENDSTDSNNKTVGEELLVSIFKESVKPAVGHNNKEDGQVLSVGQSVICSLAETLKTSCQQTIQDCDNYSMENFQNCDQVEQINKICANEASPLSSYISDEESSLADTKFSISIKQNDNICNAKTPVPSIRRKNEMSNFPGQGINKYIKGNGIVFSSKQSTGCDTEGNVKLVATDDESAHRRSEQLPCPSNAKKLTVSNIFQDNTNQSNFSSTRPSPLLCTAHVTAAASFKTGKHKQSDGIELLLTPISKVAVRSLLPTKNLKQINLICTKGQMLLDDTQKSISNSNFTQNVVEQNKLSCTELNSASVSSNSSSTDLSLNDNTELASSCSNAELLLVHPPKESVEMQVYSSESEDQVNVFESKTLTSMSSETNTSSRSNKIIPIKGLKKVSVLRNSRRSLITSNEEIFVEVVCNESVRQKDELKSISLGVQSPMGSITPHKNVKRVSLLKNSGQSLQCSSQNSNNLGISNVTGSLSGIIRGQLATPSRNSIKSAITSNKQSSLLVTGKPLLINNVNTTNSLCRDVLNQYTVQSAEVSERKLLSVPILRDSELILEEKVSFSNSLLQPNISPTKHISDSEKFSTLTIISESVGVKHKSNDSQQVMSTESVAGSEALIQDKDLCISENKSCSVRECRKKIQQNINHKRHIDAAEEALVSLALEMASEFDVLCKRRKRMFKEKTLSLLKSLLHEQDAENAATSAANIRLKRSDEKYFLHNGLLYKYL